MYTAAVTVCKLDDTFLQLKKKHQTKKMNRGVTEELNYMYSK